MKINIYNGLSSLLFIIPCIKSVLQSSNVFWNISCSTIIISSFLCNAHDYNNFLWLDYVNIHSISISYINNPYINIPLTTILVFEYTLTNNIQYVHNISFIIAMYKCSKNTYYQNIYNYYLLISTFYIGTLFYLSRLLFLHNNQAKLILTIFWHICITNILYIASNTA